MSDLNICSGYWIILIVSNDDAILFEGIDGNEGMKILKFLFIIPIGNSGSRREVDEKRAQASSFF